MAGHFMVSASSVNKWRHPSLDWWASQARSDTTSVAMISFLQKTRGSHESRSQNFRGHVFHGTGS